eukprot:1852445-Pyramimonas_sp.AAC.1
MARMNDQYCVLYLAHDNEFRPVPPNNIDKYVHGLACFIECDPPPRCKIWYVDCRDQLDYRGPSHVAWP